MKKMIFMIALFLLSTISFANEQQNFNDKLKDGLNSIHSNLNETKEMVNEFNSLKKDLSSNVKNVDFNSFKTNQASTPISKSVPKQGILQTTSNGIGTVYGDGKSAVSTVYSDLKSLAPDAKEAMKEIIGTLKSTSKYTWDLLVKQQTVWSWCYLFAEILSLVCVFRFFKQLNVTKNEKNETGDTLFVNWLQLFITGVLSMILTGISIAHFEQMVTGFMNPEFGAIRTLVEFGVNLKQ